MKKKKIKKQRNYVAKNLFLYNKPKVEEDKRRKQEKHKHQDSDYSGSFSFVSSTLL